MKIDKELLEKYHKNQCTTEEIAVVEEWLFSTESGDALQLPLNESKAVHKTEIWQQIVSILPSDDQLVVNELTKPIKWTSKTAFWNGAIAASLVLGLMITIFYQFVREDKRVTELVDINNTSLEKVRHLNSDEYTIAVGTNTSARIDNITGVVDLSGSILICPKKDVELSFTGSSKKIMFKKDQTYILLKGKDGKDQILIVDKKNLMDLPPVLQKQIIHEFNI